MKLEFKNIHIENFLSIGTADVSLNDGGYTLVNGINLNPDDNAKSNGSGKSTIFEAIIWCITGETLRGSKDITNIHGNDGALVELTFLVDNNDYKLLRTKEHSKYKNNLKIFINNEDKSGKGIKDSTKLLEEYLPDLTTSLIGSVIILGQGLPQRFTNNTPAGRKEVLEKLSKSDFMLNDLKTRIYSRKNALNTDLRLIEDAMLSCDSKISVLESQIKENKIKLDSLGTTETIDSALELLNGSILDAQIKLNTENEYYCKEKETYQKIVEKKDELNKELLTATTNYNSIYNKIVVLNNKIRDSIDEVNSKYASILSTFDKDIIKISTEIKSKQDELYKLNNIKDHCPTCGQKLPGVFKPDTTNLEAELQALNSKKLKVNNDYKEALDNKEKDVTTTKHASANELDKLSIELTAIKDTCTKLHALIDGLDKDLNDSSINISTYMSNITALENKINNYKERINSLKIEKESLESKKQVALSVIDNNTLKISGLKTEYIEKSAAKDVLNKRIEIINKMNTIITRDFRGYLLTNIINFIDARAKEYALDVFETDKIEFILEGNNISIIYDDKYYENLSGGEKQKIDIIIQFAIRDMLCKYLGFSSNILVLDEICDNVDSVGAEKLFNMISTKLIDVQDVFIISHHTDFQLPCDRQLTIIKTCDKISKIEYTV